jgi:hypothetical protein
MMLLMGGNVSGGKVYGKWPGLEEDQLFGPGDLAITKDYPDVLGEILMKHMLNPEIETIFPGYHVNDLGFLQQNSIQWKQSKFVFCEIIQHPERVEGCGSGNPAH